MRRLVVLTLLVVAADAASASAASWTVQSTPGGARAASSELVSVACGSDSGCIAVGSSTTHAGKARALAERWHAGTWSLQSLPAIAGSPQTFFTGVACVAENWCTAVGERLERTGRWRTLAEHWNGSHWTVQTTPNPSPSVTFHELNAISCSSSDDCVAVGDFGQQRYKPSYAATFQQLIARWNGHRWNVQQTSHASTGTTDRLEAVSCASASNCLAVGDRTATRTSGPLAWRWDGHRWQNVHPPNHGAFAGLLGVSCSTADACTAVGHFFVSRDQENIAEQWNGSHWKVRTPSRPRSTGAAELTGVSCRSPSACVAVGATGPADPTGGQAALWNGSDWTVQATPHGDGWPLEQVACRPAFCIAVGHHGSSTLAERYG